MTGSNGNLDLNVSGQSRAASSKPALPNLLKGSQSKLSSKQSAKVEATHDSVDDLKGKSFDEMGGNTSR